MEIMKKQIYLCLNYFFKFCLFLNNQRERCLSLFMKCNLMMLKKTTWGLSQEFLQTERFKSFQKKRLNQNPPTNISFKLKKKNIRNY